jgi:2,4-dienoyl-CoA reductase-like NADH-dependent reductase (Old Yellow Enzyme family)
LGLEDEQIENCNKLINLSVVKCGSWNTVGACRSQSKCFSHGMGKKLDAIRGWQTVAPSAIGYHDNEATPMAMMKKRFKSDYETATKRSVQVGKVMEIHARIYLLHQFYRLYRM